MKRCNRVWQSFAHHGFCNNDDDDASIHLSRLALKRNKNSRCDANGPTVSLEPDTSNTLDGAVLSSAELRFCFRRHAAGFYETLEYDAEKAETLPEKKGELLKTAGFFCLQFQVSGTETVVAEKYYSFN